MQRFLEIRSFRPARLLPGAIVLGGNVNGLGVIRSLGRLGVRTAALLSPDISDHARYSKYLKTFIQISEDDDDNELLVALTKLAAQLDCARPLLIPTTDAFSQFLASNQDLLSDKFVFNAPPLDLCDTFLDKWKTSTICKENKILIPATYCPQSFEELDALSEELKFPVIVKPRYTFDSNFPGKNAQFLCFDSLLRFFEHHNVLGSAIVQNIVPSGDGDIIVLASYSDSRSAVKAMYSGRKLRQYLPDYGATSFGISEPIPTLVKQTRQFLEKIQYRGFAMIEFAQNRSDGNFYFLELNTRTSWTNQLFSDAGIDLTQIGYLDMIGDSPESVLRPPTQRNGVIWIDFRRDLAAMRLKRKDGRIRMLEWLISIMRATSYAHWSWRDPYPFFAACALRFKRTFLRAKTSAT
jgi:predicted ATP-grasp superfamily ATP-dependent carboligase